MTPTNPTPSATAQADHEAPGTPVEWTVPSDGHRVVIQSADFKHDARLKVDGDFANLAEKIAYAAAIADKLNAAPASSAAQVAGPDMVLVPREPTAAMREAACVYSQDFALVMRGYRAMLAAAPVSQVSKGERE